ncbi:hypothetical protein NDU88_004429 [Pleurodeles waltl]|uniref:Uncharacterized protein n=1 Tax=Pleurodeles waltl TaxID=8319 RepID=A0AAV7KZW0_PLEWA|nr:hypothetical protein NDU88_004429 [Pleurodeles waltl]
MAGTCDVGARPPWRWRAERERQDRGPQQALKLRPQVRILELRWPTAAPGAGKRPGHRPLFPPSRPADAGVGEQTAPRPNTYGGPTLESHLPVPPPFPPGGRRRAGSPSPLRLDFLPPAELVTGGPANGAPGTATPTSQPHPLQRKPFLGAAEAPQRTEAQELSR